MQELARAPGYYAILPARVRYDRRLAPMERILYAEITALAQADGSCWARNQYFCNLYGVAEPTVRRWVASLQKYGYISSELMTKNNKIVGRRITLVSQPAETAQNRADGAKNDAETAQNRAAYNRYNNTSNNNTPLPPKGECDESERMFGIFWSAYPRKADKKKPSAPGEKSNTWTSSFHGSWRRWSGRSKPSSGPSAASSRCRQPGSTGSGGKTI